MKKCKERLNFELWNPFNFDLILCQNAAFKQILFDFFVIQLCVILVDLLTTLILAGTRVMCDSNRVRGTVKQYLVTNSNDLVINDLGIVWTYTKGLNWGCLYRMFGQIPEDDAYYCAIYICCISAWKRFP